MEKPSLIQIGNRILNLAAVRYIEFDGPQLINVYIVDEERPLQFVEEEADTLRAILASEHVLNIQSGTTAFHELMGEIRKPH